jgi:hypothetical protein
MLRHKRLDANTHAGSVGPPPRAELRLAEAAVEDEEYPERDG